MAEQEVTKIFTEIETDTHHKPYLRYIYLTYVANSKVGSLNDRPNSFCMEAPFDHESAETIINLVLSNLKEEPKETNQYKDGYCISCGYPGCEGDWDCPGAY